MKLRNLFKHLLRKLLKPAPRIDLVADVKQYAEMERNRKGRV